MTTPPAGPRGWRNLGEQPVVETPWFRLRQARVELPGGRQLDHYLLRLPALTMTAMLDGESRVAIHRGPPEADFWAERIEWIPLTDAPALISGGQVKDASTAAALLWPHESMLRIVP